MGFAERTRQWLKSAELATPVSNQATRKPGIDSRAAQRQRHLHLQPVTQKRTGWLSMFDCFRPHNIEPKQSPAAHG